MAENKSVDIWNIIEKCEQSELKSFAYRDPKMLIQFSKNEKEENAFGEHEIEHLGNLKLEEKVYEEIDENVVTVSSPFVGTVDYSDLLKVNQGLIPINEGDIICTIEAMKIYNDIKSPITGMIVQIIAEDGSLVEFDQTLVKIKVKDDE